LAPSSSLDAKRPKSSRPGEPVADDAEFLAALGTRVRELREQRGMARKILARDADVSERYLAQLELGEGNVSVVLLRRIALALGVSPQELLSDDGRTVEHRLITRLLERLPEHRLEEMLSRLMRDLGVQDSARKRRIALIGLRGAGKSTLGGLLAAELHVPLIELDREVAREAGMALSEVFLLYGQGGYRRLERRCLERVIEMHEHAVITVGGGIVSELDTFNLLLSNCFTVWLKASPEEHMTRVAEQGDLRPMQDNEEAMEDLRRILSARQPLYAKADAQVDTSGQKPEESLTKLRQAVTA
jgi:XRE family transcriptional regulator, aerobic/anaerobic benzoate catabolism transcriptional regulator